jgi:hypothetical protein
MIASEVAPRTEWVTVWEGRLHNKCAVCGIILTLTEHEHCGKPALTPITYRQELRTYRWNE